MIQIKQDLVPDKVCFACSEAITNPICQNCLMEEVATWLKRSGIELVEELKKRTKEFKEMTDHIEDSVMCVVCKGKVNACAHCYVSYIKEWLSEIHPELMKEFNLFFNYDLDERPY